MTIFEMPAYAGDHRGGKLETAKRRVIDGVPSEHFADLCGPDEVVEQVLNCWPGLAEVVAVPHRLKSSVSHSLYFKDGLPDEVRDLLRLLKQVVSIPAPDGVDCAIALDWYKIPDPDVPSEEWEETEMGECIRFTKHATQPTWSNSRRKWSQLVSSLADFVNSHPLYADADVVTAAPGSAADGNSFGERLALAVAKRTRIPFIGATAEGARPEQKGGTRQDLSMAFTMDSPVEGTIVIVDDVYRTGATMSGAALAARRAGATNVYGLTAARTMRN